MITIPATGHFSPEECLWYLHRGNDEVLYQVKGNEVRRAFAFDGSKVLVNIRLVPE